MLTTTDRVIVMQSVLSDHRLFGLAIFGIIVIVAIMSHTVIEVARALSKKNDS